MTCVVIAVEDGHDRNPRRRPHHPHHRLFVDVASGSPEEIIERMLQGGEEWAEGRPQDDDITLVV